MPLRKRYMFVLLAVLTTALAPAAAVGAAPDVTVVTSGLQGPRSVVFIGERAVVSESGTGGPDCFQSFLGEACVGKTSQVTWVNTKTGAHTVLADGFFSQADAQEQLGVSGLAVLGHTLYAQISGTSREVPSSIVAGQQAGDLIAINPANGSWKTLAKVGDLDFDFTTKFTEPTPGVYSPGTQEHDANPTGLLAADGAIFVADSGANLVARVSPSGKLSRVHYFPWRDPNPNNFPSDEVPTCIAPGEEGFWVGTLAGHLFRLDDEGSATQVVPKDSGGKPLLTHVTGCASSEDGTLYLVQMFGPGAAFQDPSFFNGSVVTYQPETGHAAVLADTASVPTLFLPYSATIGPDGNLYVTAGAVCGAQGQGPPGCTAGNVKGGRLLKINLPHQGD